MSRLLLLLALPVALVADSAPVVRPTPRLQTDPVAEPGDALDDPALWIHPTDPARSLLLASNKQAGLLVYNLDGKLVQSLADRSRPNNVDVLYDYPSAEGPVDLAVASLRQIGKPGLGVWRIDPKSTRLSELARLPALVGDEPYGLCTYHSRKTGRCFVFVNSKRGRFEQHELRGEPHRLSSRIVRRFRLPSQPEGCVADDELGHLYLGEEKVGIHKLSAEPDAGTTPRLIARVGQHGLAADIEGLALYCAADGKGYLLASSQGNHSFKVFRRDGDNPFVLTIDPAPGKLGKPRDSDGIAVTNRPTSRLFPRGLFVVHDGRTGFAHRQRFLLYAWEDLAADRLLIDPSWSPRRPPRAP